MRIWIISSVMVVMIAAADTCVAQIGSYEVALKSGLVFVQGISGVKYALAPRVVMRLNTITGAVTACDPNLGTATSCATSSAILPSGTAVYRFRIADQTLDNLQPDPNRLIELLIFDSTNGDVYACRPVKANSSNIFSKFSAVGCLKV
jgi:hypothetical protein